MYPHKPDMKAPFLVEQETEVLRKVYFVGEQKDHDELRDFGTVTEFNNGRGVLTVDERFDYDEVCKWIDTHERVRKLEACFKNKGDGSKSTPVPVIPIRIIEAYPDKSGMLLSLENPATASYLRRYGQILDNPVWGWHLKCTDEAAYEELMAFIRGYNLGFGDAKR